MGSGLSASEILLLAVAAATKLAQGRSSDEIGLLAAFFSVLGDNLALLALEPDEDDENSSGEKCP